MALTSGIPVNYALENAPRSGDPAERLDFARSSAVPRIRFDMRSEAQLEADAFELPSALERERALWELADRTGVLSVPTVLRFVAGDPEPVLRRHALWLLVQLAGRDVLPQLDGLLDHEDREFADWARVLHADLSGQPARSVYDTATVREDGAFDQTLPLVISGHVLVDMPEVGFVEARLSPLWFESIMGRVMACTNQSTIRTNLVIEKAVDGLHPDGSKHFEIFNFRGMSTQVAERSYEHHYLSLTERPFYKSLRMESGPELPAVPIELQRIALTHFAAPGQYGIAGEGPRAERMRTAELPFVTSVRGRYHGWAAVNLAAVAESGTVGPFDVQLANPTHPEVGPLTNARLYGLFRGKISDHDGDGAVDINSIPCHGTVDGEHDLYCDGTKVGDPYRVSA